MLDDLDKRLISLLQQDARRTNRELAAELGVAPGTVGARLKRLEATKAIRFAAFTDFLANGDQLLLLLLIRVGSRPPEDVAKELAALPGALTITVITGSWDIWASYLRPDSQSALCLLTDELGGISGITTVDSSLSMDIIVSKPVWEFTGFESSIRRDRSEDR